MKNKIIISTICILIISPGIYHFSKYTYYSFNHISFRLPNANKVQKIIDCGGIDPLIFKIFEYGSEDIPEVIIMTLIIILLKKIIL